LVHPEKPGPFFGVCATGSMHVDDGGREKEGGREGGRESKPATTVLCAELAHTHAHSLSHSHMHVPPPPPPTRTRAHTRTHTHALL
jgi:hypothetical protein